MSSVSSPEKILWSRFYAPGTLEKILQLLVTWRPLLGQSRPGLNYLYTFNEPFIWNLRRFALSMTSFCALVVLIRFTRIVPLL